MTVKMNPLEFFLGLVLVVVVTCQGPPQVKGNYKSSGEMVETVEDMNGLLLQIAFDESYNADTKDAVFRIWENGVNITYVENFQTNQTFKYTTKGCELQTIEEWVQTKSPPQLLNYEDSNGTVRFSLKQLFSLSDKFLQERNLSSEFRGMPARKWMYKMKGIESVNNTRVTIDVYAYWSDGSFNTTSYERMSVPLGFVITKMQYSKFNNNVVVHRQFVNVFSFLPDVVDEKLFEPISGIVCPGRKHSRKFPSLQDIQTLSYHSEFVLPEYQEIGYVDTYLDPFTSIIRIDMERKQKDPENDMFGSPRKYQTEIAISKFEIVYRMNFVDEQLTCQVIPFNQYKYDIQNIVHFKGNTYYWTIKRFFGINDTSSYVYLGETMKRDVPCHLYQGIRTDWPEPDAGVQSLWEWCISSNMSRISNFAMFSSKEFDLVDARIKIIESEQPGDFPQGLTMYHHFYDIQNIDVLFMYMTKFDISRCFDEHEKRELQFEVDWKITEENIHLVENATSDVGFLFNWRNELYYGAELDLETLRIHHMRSNIMDNKLYVKFNLLPPHKDLPKERKDKEKSSFEAEQSLREKINSGRITIIYIPDNTVQNPVRLKLNAVKHSLQFQVNRTSFEFNTVEPLLETTPITGTRQIFTLPPDDRITPTDAKTVSSETETFDSSSTDGATKPSEEPTDNPEREFKPNNKHKGPTIAAVSVTMLLFGMSVGAIIIYVFFNGFPKCLKCGKT